MLILFQLLEHNQILVSERTEQITAGANRELAAIIQYTWIMQKDLRKKLPRVNHSDIVTGASI